MQQLIEQVEALANGNLVLTLNAQLDAQAPADIVSALIKQWQDVEVLDTHEGADRYQADCMLQNYLFYLHVEHYTHSAWLEPSTNNLKDQAKLLCLFANINKKFP